MCFLTSRIIRGRAGSAGFLLHKPPSQTAQSSADGSQDSNPNSHSVYPTYLVGSLGKESGMCTVLTHKCSQ